MSLPVLGVHMSNTNPRAPQAIVVPLSNAAFRFWFILAISLNTLQIIPDVHKALGKTLLRENSSGDLSTLKSSLSLFGGYRRCYVRNSEGHVNVPCTRPCVNRLEMDVTDPRYTIAVVLQEKRRASSKWHAEISTRLISGSIVTRVIRSASGLVPERSFTFILGCCSVTISSSINLAFKRQRPKHQSRRASR